jgi:hypothetical protein
VATTLNRVLTPGATPRAGEYTRETESRRALLSCPVCSHLFELPPGHAPNVVGVVNYEVKCSASRCSFADFVVLADHWIEPT